MLGVYQGGRTVVDNDSVEWRAENLSESQIGTKAQHDTLDRIAEYSLLVLSRPGRRSCCWRAARARCTSGAAA